MKVPSRYKPTTLHMLGAYGVVALCMHGVNTPIGGDNGIMFWFWHLVSCFVSEVGQCLVHGRGVLKGGARLYGSTRNKRGGGLGFSQCG